MTFWSNLQHDARVIRTAAALVDAGARVTVVCTDTLGNLPREELHPRGFLIRRVRRPSPRKIRVVGGQPQIGRAGAIWAALRGALAHLRVAGAAYRTRADAYHSADIFPLIATWLVAKIRRRPIIYEAYEISTDREGFQPVVGVISKVERYICRRVDGMFATTEMRAEHFEQAYGIERPRVLQNRPPFQAPVASNLLRERCGIEAETPVILYQGGLQPGRGLFNLLGAFQRIRGAALVLLGNGILKQALRQRIDQLDLGCRVHVLAAVPAQELHRWTCSADIGVQVLENTCLNHYTTDSNKLFEYVMAGLAVVASDFPEIRKVVCGHELGALVDPADVSAIAESLQQLIDDPSKRSVHQARASRAARQLSWETQVPMLESMYNDLGILPLKGVRVG